MLADRALSGVVERFAGLPYLLLKGPATADLLGGDPTAPRLYHDVDVLVPVDAMPDAVGRLEAAGFRRKPTPSYRFSRHRHAVPFERPPGEHVDLHLTVRDGDLLAAPALEPVPVWRAAARDQVPIEWRGLTVPVPSRAFRLFALVMSMSLSELDTSDARANVRSCANTLDLEEWREARSIAVELGLAGRFQAKLGLVEGLPAPVAALRGDAPVPRLYRAALRGRPTAVLAMIEWASLPSLAERWRYLLDRLLPRMDGLSPRETWSWRIDRWRRLLGRGLS
jgi:hypothetical protein